LTGPDGIRKGFDEEAVFFQTRIKKSDNSKIRFSCFVEPEVSGGDRRTNNFEKKGKKECPTPVQEIRVMGY
jgi:hypothetical protein